jgi:putative addiction module killer protein
VFTTPQDVIAFRNHDGRVPVEEWLNDLNDKKAAARVLARLARLRQGNPGDWKPVGEGVRELRVDYGPGYRVYFGQKDRKTATSAWQENIGVNLDRVIYERR